MSWLDEDILKLLDDRGPMTAAEISEALGIVRKKIYERLTNMEVYRMVRTVGKDAAGRKLWNADRRDIIGTPQ